MENRRSRQFAAPVSDIDAPQSAEVLIIGGGPVGLLLGNLLGAAGVGTVILERRTERSSTSRAIGIMPPSLEVLERAGLRERIETEAVRVREARVYGERGRLGSILLRDIPAPFPFILSLAQWRTEAILEEGLARFPGVRLLRGWEAVGAEPGPDGVVVPVREIGQTGPEGPAERWRCRFLCVCDGAGSGIAAALGVPRRRIVHNDAFLMGDFLDRTGLGDAAYLRFTPQGSVESFPLPGGVRRWIVQTERFLPEPPSGLLEKSVEDRAGITLRKEDLLWHSTFRTATSFLSRFTGGQILFCGDAAHTVTPIGGQGMNLGFADADLAAGMLEAVLRLGADREELFARYEWYRKRAVRRAAFRAWYAMKIGTVRGQPWARLRDRLVALLLRSPLAKQLPAHFSMVTLPFVKVSRLLQARRTGGGKSRSGVPFFDS